jgi:hypothetical protein
MYVCRYDESGKEGLEHSGKVDAGALYAMLFGSEKFEPIIGELKMASQMQQEEKKGVKVISVFINKVYVWVITIVFYC